VQGHVVWRLQSLVWMRLFPSEERQVCFGVEMPETMYFLPSELAHWFTRNSPGLWTHATPAYICDQYIPVRQVDALQRLSLEWLRVMENTQRSDEDFAPLAAMADKYWGKPLPSYGPKVCDCSSHTFSPNAYRMD